MVEPSLGSWLKVWLCDLDACIICGNEWSKTVDERCSVQMRVFVVQEGQLASRGLAPGLPFFTQALHEGTLEHVCTLIDLALAVSCIALLLLGYVLVLVIGCDCACACGCACAVLCCAVLYLYYVATVQTPAPWDTERCVALARVLTARGDLCKAVPVSGSDKVRQ